MSLDAAHSCYSEEFAVGKATACVSLGRSLDREAPTGKTGCWEFAAEGGTCGKAD